MNDTELLLFVAIRVAMAKGRFFFCIVITCIHGLCYNKGRHLHDNLYNSKRGSYFLIFIYLFFFADFALALKICWQFLNKTNAPDN